MQSRARTVAEYLDSLPLDRRVAIEAVRKVVLANVDDDVAEGMYYGMITWHVPHRVFPAGYHCDPTIPLPYAALALQKQYMSLYVHTIYSEGDDAGWFRTAWEKTGRKLDMGKSCIRFRSLDDVALDVVAAAIRRMPTRRHIELYLQSRADARAAKPAKPKPKAQTKAKAKARGKATRTGAKAR